MMVRAIFMSVLPVLVVGVAFVQSACVPLLVTGAVVGTAAVVTDRRTTGAQLDDEMIEDKNSLAIHERFRGGEFHINVTSYNGIVLLTGEVPVDALTRTLSQPEGDPLLRADRINSEVPASVAAVWRRRSR